MSLRTHALYSLYSKSVARSQVSNYFFLTLLAWVVSHGFFEGHWTSEKSPTCNINFFLVFLSIFGSFFFSVFFLFLFFVSSFPFHSLSRILSVSLRFKERAPQKPDLFAAEALREPIPATMLLPKKCVVVVVDVVVVG